MSETFVVEIAENRAEGLRLGENAEQAAALSSKLDDMRADLTRLQRRHDAFAALGDEHLESAFESYDARFHTVIQWEPMKSLLSGAELAAKVAVNVEHLQGEIAKAEAEIELLLHGEQPRSKKR